MTRHEWTAPQELVEIPREYFAQLLFRQHLPATYYSSERTPLKEEFNITVGKKRLRVAETALE